MQQKLLILDLDETLIYATEQTLPAPPAFKVGEYDVYTRPYLQTFLTQMAQHFELAIWSSAGDDYVQQMVQHIQPDSMPFAFTWGRSKCTVKRDLTFDEYYFEKPLKKLKSKGYILEQIIMVDDSHEKFKSNYGNAIRVDAYTGQATDHELYKLAAYLLTLKEVPNVRTVEKRFWREHPQVKALHL